jgi:putative SOS response-associated peptidase YedK
VPATAFCEPDEGKPARWHWFVLKGNVDRPLFAFAGIYRQWKGPTKKDGDNVDIEVFLFMTTLLTYSPAQSIMNAAPFC